MIIGCDLDGTVCDNLALLVDELNNFTGDKIKLEDISEYDVTKVYNITKEQFIQLMRQREEFIADKSPLIIEADTYLKKLADDKHKIHIITARSPKLKAVTSSWLNHYGLPFHGLHLLDSHDKVAICKSLGVDVMIEDNYNNAVQLAKAGINVILFDAPHNLNWNWEGERCSLWQEIYMLITKLDY
ncbi:MAG: hypothetical protein FH758_05155 [Firmicutes bacterium]|nr:hypothetical protein [Bacillota bacterium]